MKVVNRKGETELVIYEAIGVDPWFGGGVGAKDVLKALKAVPAGDRIVVRINSEGGDVFEGMAIYNALVADEREVVTQVDGMAFSAASYIFMASATRRMAENAFLMIHDAWGLAVGTAADMRERANLLDEVSDSIGKIYVDATGNEREVVDQWMADETWFTIGPEGEDVLDAVEAGFATETVENLKLAASGPRRFDPRKARVSHVPEAAKSLVIGADTRARQAIASMGQRVLRSRRSSAA